MQLFAFLLFPSLALSLSMSKEPSPCRPDLLAVYRLTLRTNWDEVSFPRQYPLWRPPAQWSKTLGFSHKSDFNLFSLGEPVSPGVKDFVETADSVGLDSKRGSSSLLDSFTAAPISRGAGNTTARIFLDGRHTMVSLLTKMVPSPDWFIGLDSLNLCQGGHFVDSLTMEADPLDAGTDNGFTFTSPNWPTEPAGVAFRITSTYPPHPAGSFHYPHLANLPTIATFTFVKEAEYSLSQQFPLNDDRLRYSVEPSPAQESAALSFVPMESRRTKRKLELESSTLRPTSPTSSSSTTSTSSSSSSSSKTSTSSSPSSPSLSTSSALSSSTFGLTGLRNKPQSSRKLKLAEALGIGTDKATLYQSILRSYKQSPGKSLARGRRRRMRGERRQRRHREKKVKDKQAKEKLKQDCKVGEWGEWGSCSKTCDIGETTRIRRVINPARHGGRSCPPLTEFRWCGSGANCKEKYFGW